MVHCMDMPLFRRIAAQHALALYISDAGVGILFFLRRPCTISLMLTAQVQATSAAAPAATSWPGPLACEAPDAPAAALGPVAPSTAAPAAVSSPLAATTAGSSVTAAAARATAACELSPASLAMTPNTRTATGHPPVEPHCENPSERLCAVWGTPVCHSPGLACSECVRTSVNTANALVGHCLARQQHGDKPENATSHLWFSSSLHVSSVCACTVIVRYPGVGVCV